jgi:hypothetical protein
MNVVSQWIWDEGIPAEELPDHKWRAIRTYRNELLSRCDWTQLPDAPLELWEKEAWAIYRQQLRDIPDVYENPDDVVIPFAPNETP